jgi:cadmium resistance protein CadD (predicted permease)
VSVTPQLQIVAVAVVGFLSTSLDNLGVLVALFAAREIAPWRLAAIYFAVTWTLIGLGWGMSALAEYAIEENVGYLGVVPIALGIRSAWLLRHPGRDASASVSTVAGSIAAALLMFATSADNLLVALSLFADAARALDPTLCATLVACSVGWCALAFWLARRSPVAMVLQRAVRPLLPLLLVAVGVYILIDTATDVPRKHLEHAISLVDAAQVESVPQLMRAPKAGPRAFPE